MDQTELLDFLLNVVEAQHLSYAIAGSHASMAFGEARFTNDIDVVIGLAPAKPVSLSTNFIALRNPSTSARSSAASPPSSSMSNPSAPASASPNSTLFSTGPCPKAAKSKPEGKSAASTS